MAPTRILAPNIPVGTGAHSSRLVYVLFTLAGHAIQHAIPGRSGAAILKREEGFDPHSTKSIVFACLIPVLVLLSGLFAGLTLGYMSLDQTQLNVLSVSGTADQRKYAAQIMPIRKNGHLLLVTLLLANMIVNESLPVIADPVLGGGVQSVAVSTVLIVIFSEIIPQSLFTRHGLYLGAKAAGLTKCLIYTMGIIAWPVAKLLDWILGSNHGIIYRRVELKELIALHASTSSHGGDLKHDTVTIIGATLDLQEKVVQQAMTPIDDVFMLHIDAKLDYETLAKIVATGHSRVPVYEEVELPLSVKPPPGANITKVKKIVGIFLVKQCVLLDPKDATPLKTLQLNRVPFVPSNESLLGILDKFQEGRSHMAIVSRFSAEKAKSVKKAVTGKRGLTRRFLDKVGMGDTSSEESSEEEEEEHRGRPLGSTHGDDTLRGDGVLEKDFATTDDSNSSKKKHKRKRKAKKADDVEMQTMDTVGSTTLGSFAGGMTSMYGLEQNMPADAVLAPEHANDFLQSFDPAVMPFGIITLEDVLEELIGEEIYDEFDVEGAHGEPYIHGTVATAAPASPEIVAPIPVVANKSLASVKGFSFLRSRSAPPRERPAQAPLPAIKVDDEKQTSDLVMPPAPLEETEKDDKEKTSNPALEAVLLDRKRRLVREGTGSSARTPTPGVKGKFKSAPLGSSNLNPATSANVPNEPSKQLAVDHLNPLGRDTDVEDR